ncbi:MAG: hypothetical protein H7263_11060, partial [Candidatus Sericytochromatia bacterium]|nr:hypothetical protein [Candidatus Sericytochromatia bacterium]
MKKNIILSLLVLSIFSPASFANSEMNDLKAGKPVIKETINKTTKATETHLTFLIKSTPQKIWDILMDYEKYPEFMPVKEVKTKSRHGSYDIVFIRPEAPAMFDVSYDLKRTYFKNEWKIAFEKSAGKIK